MEKVVGEIAALAMQLAAAAKDKADEKTLPDAASLKEAPKNEKWKKGTDGPQKEKKATAAQPTLVQPVAVQSAPVQPVVAAPPAAPQPAAVQSAANQPAVTQPATAQPPVAQAVEVAPAPPVFMPGAEAAKTPPAEPFVIQTRGRIGKAPRKTVKGEPEEQRSEPKGDKKRGDTIYTPLVLAGAIGGGGVLVLGLGIAVICVLTLRNAGRPLVDSAEAPTTTQVVAMNDAGGATPAENEANPEAPADVNPEVTVAAPAEADAPVKKVTAKSEPEPKPTEKKEPASSAPAAGSAAGKAPATEPAAAESKTSPAPETKAEPAPIAAEPKPAAPEAKPAAKPAAKPKTTDPFAGFAKAVALPELPDMPDASSAATLSPIELGPCAADEKAKLTINLLGGDTAIRAPKQKLELQPKTDSGREWNFVLSGGAAPINVATLAAQNGKLMFQWTEDGVKQAALAKQLCNCALALGEKRQIAALRTAERGAPLPVDIDKAGASVKWNIGDLPLAKQVYIEATRAEGFKVLRQEPKNPANVGDALFVHTGEKTAPLILKLATSSTANAVEVRLQPTVRLEGWPEARPYRRKELVNLQQQQGQDLTILTKEHSTLKSKSIRLDSPEYKVKEATLERMSKELVALNTVLDQLRFILDFSGATDIPPKIHFRVYCLAGDAKIDLLRTEDEPPPEKRK